MAENPNNSASVSTERQSFDSIMESALGELNGSSQTSQPEPTVEQKTQPAKVVEPEQSAVADDVIEFEGKQFKIEKSAKDYLLEAMNAKKGMRKAFSERDAKEKLIKEREADLARYNQITDTFKKKGIEGLYDALAGKEGAYGEHLKKREDLAIRKYNASADEIKMLEQEELIERERALREMAERTTKETLENIERKEMEAHKTILGARLNEAFEAVSFDGKLGDEKREAKFNRYVWEQARMQLKDYADEKKIAHHEIPAKVIKATFADIANDFEGNIKKEAASSVSKQVQVASDAATLAAQARSTSVPIKDKADPMEKMLDDHKGNPHSFINALFGKS